MATLELSGVQQLKLEDLLKSFTGVQAWNDLLTLSELTDKIALSDEAKASYTVRTFDDGRSLMDLSRMNARVQVDISSAEKRMLLRVINESVVRFTCADVEWLGPVRMQVAE